MLGGEWGCMRYNAVISSLQEENQWNLLASAERERASEHRADIRSLFETQDC